MVRYYKRQPDTIEAIQWFKHGDHPEVKSGGWINRGWFGKMLVNPGDYIIKYPNGEYYVLSKKRFETEFIRADSIKVNFLKATPMKPRTIDLC